MRATDWPTRRVVRVASILLVVVALIIAALASCGRERTGEFDVHGTLRLLNSGDNGYLSRPAGPCAGAGPYIDIADGAVVTVSAKAETLALGHLRDGARVSPTECTWTIDVPDVPAGKLRYTVAVGSGSERDFSEGDLRASPVFTLGG